MAYRLLPKIRAKEAALQTESTAQSLRPIHIPIVAMTAHAMKGDRELYLAGGMDGYVSKPINSAELERVIQSVVIQFPSPDSMPTAANPDVEKSGQENAHAEMKEANVPGIEETVIVAHFEGDIELVRELAEIFINECPSICPTFTRRFATELEHSAHALKGSVGNFSTRDAHASALQLEVLGRAGSLDGAVEILRTLEEQLAHFNQKYWQV
jgi:two-component system, sensor histidine kinase and response regulator